jgi:transposase-like protein
MNKVCILNSKQYSRAFVLNFLSLHLNEGISVSKVIKKLGGPSKRLAFYWINSYKLGNLGKFIESNMKKQSKKYDKDILKPSHGFNTIEEELTYLREAQMIHQDVLKIIKDKKKLSEILSLS